MTLTRFRRTVGVEIPSGSSDFMITLPSSQPDDDYGVFPEQVAGDSIVKAIALDDAPSDRTTTQFRVVTQAIPPDGTTYEFMVVHE